MDVVARKIKRFSSFARTKVMILWERPLVVEQKKPVVWPSA